MAKQGGTKVMNKNIMELQGLEYIYPDGTIALKGVNLHIKRGQTTALLGGNGAGKSTLMLALNGINKPSSGRVLFEDQPVDYSRKGLQTLRSAIGIVFQDPDNQLFSASVFQEIAFGPVNQKLSKEEVCRRVNQAMEQTGITHLKDKPTHSLSFGQKKRVCIADALAMSPQVLVLDEPTAGLDPKGVTSIMKLLKVLQTELGLTVIIATHDMEIVPLYCDYAYVMSEGKIVVHGTPQEVLSETETIRGAQLRLPRIGHLLEILAKRDGFVFSGAAFTIAEARKALKPYRNGHHQP